MITGKVIDSSTGFIVVYVLGCSYWVEQERAPFISFHAFLEISPRQSVQSAFVCAHARAPNDISLKLLRWHNNMHKVATTITQGCLLPRSLVQPKTRVVLIHYYIRPLLPRPPRASSNDVCRLCSQDGAASARSLSATRAWPRPSCLQSPR